MTLSLCLSVLCVCTVRRVCEDRERRAKYYVESVGKKSKKRGKKKRKSVSGETLAVSLQP